MIPTLDELRKTLLATPGVPPGRSRKQPALANSNRATGRRLSERSKPLQQSNTPANQQPPSQTHQGDASALENAVADAEHTEAEIELAEAEIEVTDPQPDDELVQAVAAVFDSAGGYREHLARLADASKSIRRLSQAADRVLEPLRSLRNQVQELLESNERIPALEPVGGFRKGFGTLARLLPTEKLAGRGDRSGATFGGHLFELSKSLEPANALHARLVKLAETFHTADALQEQLYELSQAFDAGRASRLVETGKVETGSDNRI
jgi:hypothetical protein